MTLLISNDDQEKLLTMDLVLEALQDAYVQVDAGQAANRPRTLTSAPTSTDGRFSANTHEGILTKQRVYDIRIVTTRHPPATQDPGVMGGGLPVQPNVSLDMLYDLDSGELLAILHDGYLQKVRVQATNALAARYLAKQDATRMGLLGSGWQASAAIEVMRAVRPSLREVKVFSKTPEHRESFAIEKQKQYPDMTIEAVGSAEEACAGAELLISATTSRTPVVKGEWLDPGMFLAGIQTHEFDKVCYERAHVVVLFNRLRSRTYGLTRDPVEPPVRRGLSDQAFGDLFTESPEIIDLVSGKTPGRTNDRQIFIFANGGVGWGIDGGPGYGVQFAAMSKLLYDLARKAGMGRELPKEWFQQMVHS